MKLINILFLAGGILSNPELIWPTPQEVTKGSKSVIISPSFYIESNKNSQRLERVFYRIIQQIKSEKYVPIVPKFQGKYSPYDRVLNSVYVKVENVDDKFDDETDESYSLTINDNGKATIESKSTYGVIRGLESFQQMVQYKDNKRFISNTPINVKDFPKLPHRGLLLDTSRNYYPISLIKKTIDGLSYSKMNVFHWHITDSNSWPFQSKKHPLLWKKGALFPDQVYSIEDIKEVVEYGLDRGVRIIPELEAPAHSYAMGLAYPEIGVCMDKDAWWDNAMQPPSGQIDPTNPLSKLIVNDIIDEFSTIFKDKYIHLSGDEVNLNCWKSSPNITKYVNEHNVTYNDLLESFAKGMHQKAIANKKKVMVYQEMLLNHKVDLPKDSLIHAWIEAEDTKKIVDLGYKVIASSYKYWYLDCGRGEWIGPGPGNGPGTGNSWCDPYKSWQIVYNYDLYENLAKEQYKLIHGGEVAMWSEQTDKFNLEPLLWPRTSVAGEVLWFGNKDKDGKKMNAKVIQDRINNFRFRLTDRGFNAQALQPIWCVVNPGRCG